MDKAAPSRRPPFPQRRDSVLWGLLAAFLALCVPHAGATVGGVTMTSLSTGSFSVSWTIGSQSTPTIVLSGNNFAGTISSGTGALGQNATAYANLSPNTTYWFQVKNSTEPDANYVGFNAGRSTITYAKAPLSAAVSNVASASLTANWGANGNPAGTWYQADISTDGFATVNASSLTLNTSAAFSGLLVNTTHFLRVRARNAASVFTSYTPLPDAATLANVPVAAAPSGVASSQLSANWTANGNPAGTRYRVDLDDDPGFGSINASSNTANVSAAFSGLTPNTTYHSRVEALNLAGTGSGVVALASTSTLAAVPGAAAFSNVAAASLRANWTANGNAAGTRYLVVLSTGAAPDTNGFTGNQSSQTLNVFATFSGLSANTTYFASVKAVNNNESSTAYTSLASTITLPSAPAAAAPSGVATTQLTANWGANGNPAGTRYVVQLDDDPGFGSVNASSDTANASATFTGLTPNTTYHTRVEALNAAGTGSGTTALPSTATLADVPLAAAFTSVVGASLQANWTANSNPAGTLYQAVLSTGANPGTNGFAGNQSSATLNVNAAFAGLSPGATYFVEVKAVNHNGVSTAYASLGSTRTTALLAPASFSAQVQGVSSVTWSWANVAGESGLRVVTSTDGNRSGDLAADTLSWADTGLSTNTAYTRRVVAFAGVSVATSATATAYTLAAPPTGFALVSVFVSSMSLSWGANTNPAGTQYRVEYWTAGGSTSTASFGVTTGTVTGLSAAATYYLQVRALNGDSVATSPSAQLSTTTLPVSQTSEAVQPGQPATLVYQAPSGEVRVDVPASAFPTAVTVTLETPSSFPAAVSPTATLQGTGVGVEVTVDPALQPGRDVLLSITYTDASVAGRDENQLIIARFDAVRAVWVPLPSSVDRTNNRVLARTNHFSTFQVMSAVPAASLVAPRIFPNPMRPNRGQSFTMIGNLPAGARVRVYTYLGELVRDLSANGSGIASWDGRSASGRPVASGVYILHIQGGGSDITAKVAVER